MGPSLKKDATRGFQARSNERKQQQNPMIFPPMATAQKKGYLRAFWDFFVLFSGISTASNLSRTRRQPVRSRGIFLFRQPANKECRKDTPLARPSANW